MKLTYSHCFVTVGKIVDHCERFLEPDAVCFTDQLRHRYNHLKEK